MADRDTYNDDVTASTTGTHNAAPNHGIDGNNDHDATKGGIGGAIGGAIVGGLAGGPIGAVIGAIAGGAASAAGVAAVDRHDHDGSPADTVGAGTNASFIGNDTTDTVASAPASAAYKGDDIYATDNTYATTPVASTTAAYDTNTNYNAGANTVADGTVIPIVEEELEVGKRQVQSGGIRINQTVEEVPVSEQVSLHEEHVTIDRRPVDRAVGAGDTAFQDGVYEVTETAEVPVIAKTARVVEEVVVGKVATDHVETVNDTVRRTDVDVEQIPGSTTTTGTDYRTDVNR